MKVEVIDLQFLGVSACVACFLIQGPQGPFLIECGPSTTRPHLVQELASRGLAPQDLQAVLVTHIHLDHAGSAGWWGAQGVPIYVHHLGAPHLLDPSKLLASATRIYGDRMDELWGAVPPTPPAQLRPIEGDQVLQVAGVTLQALETPGHARHHHAFRLDEAIFTGDVAGVSLPVLEGERYLSVPAPPPEFDLESWMVSLEKLQGASRLYLTHFGPLDEPGPHLNRLAHSLAEATAFVGARRDWERERLVAAYYDWFRQGGLPESSFDAYEKANPLYMSVDGLLRYWKKKDKA